MPKALKYDYCPFCSGNIQLVKAKRRKHVYQCPVCGFTIAPNWRKGRFERLTKTFQPDIEKWAGGEKLTQDFWDKCAELIYLEILAPLGL